MQAIHPKIRRLWGATASIPYPHGCRPAGALVEAAPAMRSMVTILQIGGHSDHLDDPGVQELLEFALIDQTAAVLLIRFRRGGRTIMGQLCERVVSLRA